MSESEIDLIVEKLWERFVPMLHLIERKDKGEWVTINYAITHLLSPGQRKRHGEGRKAIVTAITNKQIKKRSDGKINVKSLFEYINKNL